MLALIDAVRFMGASIHLARRGRDSGFGIWDSVCLGFVESDSEDGIRASGESRSPRIPNPEARIPTRQCVAVRVGQTVPWFCLVTGARPL